MLTYSLIAKNKKQKKKQKKNKKEYGCKNVRN